jgi:transposase
MVDTQTGRHNAAVHGWSVPMQKKRYTAEFKQQAVQLIEEGVLVRKVASDLDVSEWTIRDWLKKAKAGDVSVKPRQTLTIDDDKRRLRAENRQLKLEREIIKKATAFFASHQK